MTSSATLMAVRLSHYTRTGQSEILGDAPGPFGVADAGLAWLPR
jgi:hypothetical protein